MSNLYECFSRFNTALTDYLIERNVATSATPPSTSALLLFLSYYKGCYIRQMQYMQPKTPARGPIICMLLGFVAICNYLNQFLQEYWPFQISAWKMISKNCSSTYDIDAIGKLRKELNLPPIPALLYAKVKMMFKVMTCSVQIDYVSRQMSAVFKFTKASVWHRSCILADARKQYHKTQH